MNSTQKTIILALVLFTWIVIMILLFKVKEMDKILNKVHPMIDVPCEMAVPYVQHSKQYFVCWNDNIAELTASERKVMRQYFYFHNLPQPTLE